jgi:DNA invertase Pin-like site-specific DNA recombinase
VTPLSAVVAVRLGGYHGGTTQRMASTRKTSRLRFTSADDDRVFALRAARLSTPAIARVLGCTTTHVYKVLHRQYARQAETPSKCPRCGGQWMTDAATNPSSTGPAVDGT